MGASIVSGNESDDDFDGMATGFVDPTAAAGDDDDMDALATGFVDTSASADGASIRDPSGLSAVEVGCQTRA